MAAPARREAALRPDPAFAARFREVLADLPGGPALTELRERNFERFERLGLPTNRNEDWKYTNLAGHANRPFVLPGPATAPAPGEAAADAFEVVLVDGVVRGPLPAGLPPGVAVLGVADLLARDPERVREAASTLDDGRSFTALNAAFLKDGLWVELDDGAALDRPLRLRFMASGGEEAVMAHPRLFLRLGRGARLHLVEVQGALVDGPNLTNLVTQLWLGEGAELRHDRLQLVPPRGTHLGKLAARLGGGARYVQTVATLGGALVRNETDVRIDGPNVDCVLNGAYLPTGDERVDTLIRVHHVSPDSRSDQFYKGVVDGRARAAFQGKITVHPDAQRTNAFQQNSNLLLSDDAELDTKPELEIYADDVKCSHGATAGDLDPTALFYLRSRGVAPDTARAMLTFAFAAEVFERFADPALAAEARRAALTRLPGGEALQEIP